MKNIVLTTFTVMTMLVGAPAVGSAKNANPTPDNGPTTTAAVRGTSTMPIIESALRHAASMRLGVSRETTGIFQPAGCSAMAAEGSQDADSRQGTGGWIAGGALMPVLMPILAHVMTPTPPADTALQFTGEDARCYSAGYTSRASAKRRRSAWIGSGIGIGAYVALAVLAASGDPY